MRQTLWRRSSWYVAIDAGEPWRRTSPPLGWDLDDLRSRGLLAIDHIWFRRARRGFWRGLFILLRAAIDAASAKLAVLDTVESSPGRNIAV